MIMDASLIRALGIIEEQTARIKDLEMALDDERAHCEEFKAEAQRMEKERDDAREHADCEKQLADRLIVERDEAREIAKAGHEVLKAHGLCSSRSAYRGKNNLTAPRRTA